MTSPGGSGFSRETRLLAATIAVSLLVLFVLSRFRYPEPAPATRDSASAQPLARLAARAAFDDLSLAVRELSGRVSPSLLVVRAATAPSPGGASGGASGSDTTATTRLMPALRVRDDAALVLVDEGTTVEAVIGVTGPATVLARDPVRGLTLVRVPAAPAPVLSTREGLLPLAAPGYLAVTEASAAGAALRPVFVGRSDGMGDPRWDAPLLTMGRQVANDAGAPVFMLDGRLAGVLSATDDVPALVPADVLLATVDRLLSGGLPAAGDIGVAVQRVDATIRRATGVSEGAAVAAVRADGPAATALLPGDVITAINGQLIRTVDDLRRRVARADPGSTLAVTLRRDSAFITRPVTVGTRSAAAPAPSAANPAASDDRPLGLTLRAVARAGSEVQRVQSGSLAEAAGLRPGDLIVSVGSTRQPAPADVTTAFSALPPGRALFLSVERDGQPRLVVLQP